MTAGELGALLAHISFQFGNQRRALRLADSLSVVGALAIDRALDCEQGVDAAHDLDRNRREGDLLLASSLTSRVFLKIRHGEEWAPGMDPTGRFPDRPRTSLGLVEFGVDAVEAFHTKCGDTGIHSGVIVSSKGFYKTARAKAQHYGIRCLTLDEVEGFNWFKPTDLNVLSCELIQTRLFVAFETQLDVQVSDLLVSTGETLTNEAINATACGFLDSNRTYLPRDPGKHEIHFDIVPGFSTVIDDIAHHTTRVVMTVEYENKITRSPFQFRDYRDHDKDGSITQFAVANVSSGKFKADVVASTSTEGAILISVVPTPPKA